MGRVSAFAGWRKSGLLVFALATVAVLAASPAAAQNPKTYMITPLVSNLGPPGPGVDTRLLNAWGLVAGPTSPWWVSDNGADFSTLYNAAGGKVNLNVSVAGAPTGIVFNADANAFPVGTGANPGARFIFATEDGTIAGWRGALGTAAQVTVTSEGGAIYKELAIATAASGRELYATDFHNARVHGFDATWAPAQALGGCAGPD